MLKQSKPVSGEDLKMTDHTQTETVQSTEKPAQEEMVIPELSMNDSASETSEETDDGCWCYSYTPPTIPLRHTRRRRFDIKRYAQTLPLLVCGVSLDIASWVSWQIQN